MDPSQRILWDSGNQEGEGEGDYRDFGIETLANNNEGNVRNEDWDLDCLLCWNQEGEGFIDNGVVGETVIDNGSNILGLEQNGIVVCHAEKIAVEEFIVESLPNENEVVQQLSDDEPIVEEAVRKNELNAQTSVAVTSSERIFSRAEASERKYRTAKIIRKEDLKKYRGQKTRAETAKIFGICVSTFRRRCLEHGILNWPHVRRKKVNAIRSEGSYKGDPSCSDPPPTPAAAASISHKKSNSRQEQDVLSKKKKKKRQEQDVGTVTIKATHGGQTYLFRLSFSSTKTDLVEQLTKRLRLNEGSFHIKYQYEENDWISIACDEDLEHCIGIWKGKSNEIKMLVEQITNQAP